MRFILALGFYVAAILASDPHPDLLIGLPSIIPVAREREIFHLKGLEITTDPSYDGIPSDFLEHVEMRISALHGKLMIRNRKNVYSTDVSTQLEKFNKEIVVKGRIQDLNAALSSLDYFGIEYGNDSILVSITDRVSTPSVLAIQVLANPEETGLVVYNIPHSFVPVFEDQMAQNLHLFGIHGGSAEEPISVSITSMYGAIVALSSYHLDNITEANTVLRSMNYTPPRDWSGVDLLMIRVNQSDGAEAFALSTTQIYVLPTPDCPTLLAPSQLSLISGKTSLLTGVRIVDREFSKMPSTQLRLEVFVDGGIMKIMSSGHTRVTSTNNSHAIITGFVDSVNEVLKSIGVVVLSKASLVLTLSSADVGCTQSKHIDFNITNTAVLPKLHFLEEPMAARMAGAGMSIDVARQSSLDYSGEMSALIEIELVTGSPLVVASLKNEVSYWIRVQGKDTPRMICTCPVKYLIELCDAMTVNVKQEVDNLNDPMIAYLMVRLNQTVIRSTELILSPAVHRPKLENISEPRAVYQNGQPVALPVSLGASSGLLTLTLSSNASLVCGRILLPTESRLLRNVRTTNDHVSHTINLQGYWSSLSHTAMSLRYAVSNTSCATSTDHIHVAYCNEIACADPGTISIAIIPVEEQVSLHVSNMSVVVNTKEYFFRDEDLHLSVPAKEYKGYQFSIAIYVNHGMMRIVQSGTDNDVTVNSDQGGKILVLSASSPFQLQNTLTRWVYEPFVHWQGIDQLVIELRTTQPGAMIPTVLSSQQLVLQVIPVPPEISINWTPKPFSGPSDALISRLDGFEVADGPLETKVSVNFAGKVNIHVLQAVSNQIVTMNATCIKGRITDLNRAFRSGYVWLQHTDASILRPKTTVVQVGVALEDRIFSRNVSVTVDSEEETLSMSVNGLPYYEYGLNAMYSPNIVTLNENTTLPQMRTKSNKLNLQYKLKLACNNGLVASSQKIGNSIEFGDVSLHTMNSILANMTYLGFHGLTDRVSIIVELSNENRIEYALELYLFENDGMVSVVCPLMERKCTTYSLCSVFGSMNQTITSTNHSGVMIRVEVPFGSGVFEIAPKWEHAAEASQSFDVVTFKGSTADANDFLQEIALRPSTFGVKQVLMTIISGEKSETRCVVEVAVEEDRVQKIANLELSDEARTWKQATLYPLSFVNTLHDFNSSDVVVLQIDVSRGVVIQSVNSTLSALHIDYIGSSAIIVCSGDIFQSVLNDLQVQLPQDWHSEIRGERLGLRLEIRFGTQVVNALQWSVDVSSLSGNIVADFPSQLGLGKNCDSMMSLFRLEGVESDWVSATFSMSSGTLAFPATLQSIMSYHNGTYSINAVTIRMFNVALQQASYVSNNCHAHEYFLVSIFAKDKTVVSNHVVTVVPPAQNLIDLHNMRRLTQMSPGASMMIDNVRLMYGFSSATTATMDVTCLQGNLTFLSSEYSDVHCKNTEFGVSCGASLDMLQQLLPKIRYQSNSDYVGNDVISIYVDGKIVGTIKVSIIDAENATTDKVSNSLSSAATRVNVTSTNGMVPLGLELQLQDAYLDKELEVEINVEPANIGRIELNSALVVVEDQQKIRIVASGDTLRYLLNKVFVTLNPPPVQTNQLTWSVTVVDVYSNDRIIVESHPIELETLADGHFFMVNFGSLCTASKPFPVALGVEVMLQDMHPKVELISWNGAINSRFNITLRSNVGSFLVQQNGHLDTIGMQWLALEIERLEDITPTLNAVRFLVDELTAQDDVVGFVDVYVSVFGDTMSSSSRCDIMFNADQTDVQIISPDVIQIQTATFNIFDAVEIVLRPQSHDIELTVGVSAGSLRMDRFPELDNRVVFIQTDKKSVKLRARTTKDLRSLLPGIVYVRANPKWYGHDILNIHVNGVKSFDVDVQVIQPAIEIWDTAWNLGLLNRSTQLQSLVLQDGTELAFVNITSTGLELVHDQAYSGFVTLPDDFDDGFLRMTSLEAENGFAIENRTKQTLVVVPSTEVGVGSAIVREIQRLETVIDPVFTVQQVKIHDTNGINSINGVFTLNCDGLQSRELEHNVSATTLEAALERIPGVGSVAVSMSTDGNSYSWDVTFSDVQYPSSCSIGTSALQSLSSTIEITTISNANAVEGSFSLRYLGQTTPLIRHDVSPRNLESMLCAMHTLQFLNGTCRIRISLIHETLRGERTWEVEFLSNGNLPMIEIETSLLNSGAAIEISEYRAGTDVPWGWFEFTNIDAKTPPLPFDITAMELYSACLTIGIDTNGGLSGVMQIEHPESAALMWIIDTSSDFSVRGIMGNDPDGVFMLQGFKSIRFDRLSIDRFAAVINNLVYVHSASWSSKVPISIQLNCISSGQHFESDVWISVRQSSTSLNTLNGLTLFEPRCENGFHNVDYRTETAFSGCGLEFDSASKSSFAKLVVHLEGDGVIRVPNAYQALVADTSNGKTISLRGPLDQLDKTLRHITYVPVTPVHGTFDDAIAEVQLIRITNKAQRPKQTFVLTASLETGSLGGYFSLNVSFVVVNTVGDPVEIESEATGPIAWDISESDLYDILTGLSAWPSNMDVHVIRTPVSSETTGFTWEISVVDVNDLIDFHSIILHESHLTSSSVTHDPQVEVERVTSLASMSEDSLIKVRCFDDIIFDRNTHLSEVERMFRAKMGLDLFVEYTGLWRLGFWPVGGGIRPILDCRSLSDDYQVDISREVLPVPMSTATLRIQNGLGHESEIPLFMTFHPLHMDYETIRLSATRNMFVIYNQSTLLDGIVDIAYSLAYSTQIKCSITNTIDSNRIIFAENEQGVIVEANGEAMKKHLHHLRYECVRTGLYDQVFVDCMVPDFPFLRSNVSFTIAAVTPEMGIFDIKGPENLTIEMNGQQRLGEIYSIFPRQATGANVFVTLKISCVSGYLLSESNEVQTSKRLVEFHGPFERVAAILDSLSYFPSSHSSKHEIDWIRVTVNSDSIFRTSVTVVGHAISMLSTRCPGRCFMSLSSYEHSKKLSHDIRWFPTEQLCPSGIVDIAATAMVGAVSSHISTFIRDGNSIIWKGLSDIEDVNAILGSLVYVPLEGWTGLDSVSLAATCSSQVLGSMIEIDVDVLGHQVEPQFSAKLANESLVSFPIATLVSITETVPQVLASKTEKLILTVDVDTGVPILADVYGVSLLRGDPWNGDNLLEIKGGMDALNKVLQSIRFQFDTRARIFTDVETQLRFKIRDVSSKFEEHVYIMRVVFHEEFNENLASVDVPKYSVVAIYGKKMFPFAKLQFHHATGASPDTTYRVQARCDIGVLHIDVEKVAALVYPRETAFITDSQSISFETTNITLAESLAQMIGYIPDAQVELNLYRDQDRFFRDSLVLALYSIDKPAQSSHFEVVVPVMVEIPQIFLLPTTIFLENDSMTLEIAPSSAIDLLQFFRANMSLGFVNVDEWIYNLKISVSEGVISTASMQSDVNVFEHTARSLNISGKLRSMMSSSVFFTPSVVPSDMDMAVEYSLLVDTKSEVTNRHATLTLKRSPSISIISVEPRDNNYVLPVLNSEAVLGFVVKTPLLSPTWVEVELKSTSGGVISAICDDVDRCQVLREDTNGLVLAIMSPHLNNILGLLHYRVGSSDLDSVTIVVRIGIDSATAQVYLTKNLWTPNAKILILGATTIAKQNEELVMDGLGIEVDTAVDRLYLELHFSSCVEILPMSDAFTYEDKISGGARTTRLAGQVSEISNAVKSLHIRVGANCIGDYYLQSSVSLSTDFDESLALQHQWLLTIIEDDPGVSSSDMFLETLNFSQKQLVDGEAIMTKLKFSIPDDYVVMISLRASRGKFSTRGRDSAIRVLEGENTADIMFQGNVSSLQAMLRGKASVRVIFDMQYRWCGHTEFEIRVHRDASSVARTLVYPIDVTVACDNLHVPFPTLPDKVDMLQDSVYEFDWFKDIDAAFPQDTCNDVDQIVELEVRVSSGTLDFIPFGGISTHGNASSRTFMACVSLFPQLSLRYRPPTKFFGTVFVDVSIRLHGGIILKENRVSMQVQRIAAQPQIIFGKHSLLNVEQGANVDVAGELTYIELVSGYSEPEAIHALELSCKHCALEIPAPEGSVELLAPTRGTIIMKGTITSLNRSLKHVVYSNVDIFLGIDVLVFNLTEDLNTFVVVDVPIRIEAIKVIPKIALKSPDVYDLGNGNGSVVVDGWMDIEMDADPHAMVVMDIKADTMIARPEIQQISMERSTLSRISRVSLSANALGSSTFTLKLGQTTTSSIVQNAMASTSEEFGANRGESMESKLRGIVSSDIGVKVARTAVANYGFAWEITFTNVGANFPGIELGTISNIGSTIDAIAVKSDDISGDSQSATFVIEVGYRRTNAISVGASENDLRRALEDLPNVDLVHVSIVDSPSDFSRKWHVTFYKPGGDIPLMRVGDIQAQSGAWVHVNVSEVIRGFGTPQVYELVTSSQHVNLQQYISVFNSAGAVSGTFELGIDLTSLGGRVAKSSPIDADAVASIGDEYTSHSRESMIGSSLESKINALLSDASVGLDDKFRIREKMFVKVSKTHEQCQYSCHRHRQAFPSPSCSIMSNCDVCVGRCMTNGIVSLKMCTGDHDCQAGDSCVWNQGECLGSGKACVAHDQCSGSGNCVAYGCSNSTTGGVTWTVEVFNAPHSLPMIYIADSNLHSSSGATVVADILPNRDLGPQPKRLANALSGYFDFDGIEMPYDVPETLFANMLEKIGKRAIVMRSKSDFEGGYQWFIVSNSPFIRFDANTVDGAKLGGIGSNIILRRLSKDNKLRAVTTHWFVEHHFGTNIEPSEYSIRVSGSIDQLKEVLGYGNFEFRPDRGWEGDLHLNIAVRKLDGVEASASFVVPIIAEKLRPVVSIPRTEILAYVEIANSVFPNAVVSGNVDAMVAIEMTSLRGGTFEFENIQALDFKSQTGKVPVNASHLLFYGTVQELQELLQMTLYRCPKRFLGTDEIVLTIGDEYGLVQKGIVLVNIKSLIQTPSISLQAPRVEVIEDGTLAVSSLFGVDDGDDNEALVFTLVVFHGTLETAADCTGLLSRESPSNISVTTTRHGFRSSCVHTMLYRAGEDYFGLDTMIIEVRTFQGTMSLNRITIDVLPKNDKPEIILSDSEMVAVREDTVMVLKDLFVIEDPDWYPKSSGTYVTITTSAPHVDMKQAIRITASAGRISGSFQLGLDMTAFGGAVVASQQIRHNAYANPEDELKYSPPGSSRGNSVQDLIDEMIHRAIAGTNLNISTRVSRSNEICDATCSKHYDAILPYEEICATDADCSVCIGHCESGNGNGVSRCIANSDCGSGTCQFSRGECLRDGSYCSSDAPCANKGSCENRNCRLDASGGYTWTVTFLNAPFDMPLMTPATDNLGGATNIVFSTDLVPYRNPRPLIAPNSIAGIFEIDGTPFSWDVSAADMEAALTADRTDATVSVTRSERSLEGGYSWLLLFDGHPGSRLPTVNNRYLLNGGNVHAAFVDDVPAISEYLTVNLHVIHGSLVNTLSREKNISLMFNVSSSSEMSSVLKTVEYIPKRNWNSIEAREYEQLHITVIDRSGERTSETILIDVIAVDDTPVIQVPGQVEDDLELTGDQLSGSVKYVEPFMVETGYFTPISGVSIRDVDSREIQVSLTAFHAVVRLTDEEFAQEAESIVIRGSVSDCNRGLSTLAVKPLKLPEVHTFNASIVITVVDVPDGRFGTQTIPLVLGALHAPVLLVPSIELECEEDLSLVINEVVVDCADCQDDTLLKLEVDVQHGKLELQLVGQISPVYISEKSFYVIATQTNLNAMLKKSLYVPDVHFNTAFSEPDRISLTLSCDFGVTNEKVFVYVSPVNDAPVLKYPGRNLEVDELGYVVNADNVDVLTVMEDTLLRVRGVEVEEVDGLTNLQDGILTVELRATYGNVDLVSAHGVEVETGDHWLTMRGEVSRLNNLLSGIRYHSLPNWHGMDSLTITATDYSGDSDSMTIPIEVVPVNDAPVWSIRAVSIEGLEDRPVLLNTVKLTDVEAGINDVFHVYAQASFGELAVTPGGDKAQRLEIDATLNDVNLWLSQLVYFPSRHANTKDGEIDSIRFVANDAGHSGAEEPKLSEGFLPILRVVSVYDPPRISIIGSHFPPEDLCSEDAQLSTPLFVNDVSRFERCGSIIRVDAIEGLEDTPLTIDHVSIKDPESVSSLLSVHLAVEHGLLELTRPGDVEFVGESTFRGGIIAFVCSVVSCNSALASLVYLGLPDWHGRDALRISVSDTEHPFNQFGRAMSDSQEVPIIISPVVDTPRWERLNLKKTFAMKSNMLLRLPSNRFQVFHADSIYELVTVVVLSSGGVVTLNALDESFDVTFDTELQDVFKRKLKAFSLKRMNVVAITTTVEKLNRALMNMDFAPNSPWDGDVNDFASLSLMVLNADDLHYGTSNALPPVWAPFDIATSRELLDFDEIKIIVDTDYVSPTLSVKWPWENNTIVTQEDTPFYIRGLLLGNMKPSELVTLRMTCGSCYFSFSIMDGILATISGNGTNVATITSTTETTEALFEDDLRVSYHPSDNWNGEDFVDIHVVDLRTRLDNQIRVWIDVIPVNDIPTIMLEQFAGTDVFYRVLEGESIMLAGHHRGATQNLSVNNTSHGIFDLWKLHGGQQGSWDLHKTMGWHWSPMTNISSRGSVPSQMIVDGVWMFFAAEDESHGRELWKTMGTIESTELISDILPGSGGSSPTGLHMHSDGWIYFGAEGVDLTWMSTSDDCQGFSSFDVGSTKVAFAVTSDPNFNSRVSYDCPSNYHWASTREMEIVLERMAKEQMPLLERQVYADTCGWSFTKWNNIVRELFLFADSYETGASMHSDDSWTLHTGNIESKSFAGIVCISSPSSNGKQQNCLANGCVRSAGRELWKTDGTTVTRVYDVVAGEEGSNPKHFVTLGADLLFDGLVRNYGTELVMWSDHTMHLLRDIHIGEGSSFPDNFVFVGTNLVIFTADDGVNGRELWITDGQPRYRIDRDMIVQIRDGPSGTNMVMDINPGAAGSTPSELFLVAPGWVVFVATRNDERNIYITDGVQVGRLTFGLKNPRNLRMYKGVLHFTAEDEAHGEELWAVGSDNSFSTMLLPGESNTLVVGINSSPMPQRLIMDVLPGAESSHPTNLVVHQLDSQIPATELLFFFANAQLWQCSQVSCERSLQKTYSFLEPDPTVSMVSFGNMLVVAAQNTTRDLKWKELLPSKAMQLSQAFEIQDVDEFSRLRLSIMTSFGLLSLDNSSLTSMSNHISIEGSVDEVNRQVSHIFYVSPLGNYGKDIINISVSDSMNSSVWKGIEVYVDHVNQAPNITFAADFLSFSAGTAAEKIGHMIHISDDGSSLVNTTNPPVYSIGLKTSGGLLTMPVVKNLMPKKHEEYTIYFSATYANAVRAISSLEYQCSTKGSWVLTVFVDDNGNFGFGGSKNSVATLTLACS